MGQSWLQQLVCKEEKLFKGTIASVPPLDKFDSRRPHMSQVPLCAISSSYCSCCWVLVVVDACVITCGGNEDDVVTLV